MKYRGTVPPSRGTVHRAPTGDQRIRISVTRQYQKVYDTK